MMIAIHSETSKNEGGASEYFISLVVAFLGGFSKSKLSLSYGFKLFMDLKTLKEQNDHQRHQI